MHLRTHLEQLDNCRQPSNRPHGHAVFEVAVSERLYG